MDSLATVLRRIPLFAKLPPGSFARVIADLREEQHPAGTVICSQGAVSSDFYIIKSGECAVLVDYGLHQQEVVAISGPNEWFGERALFSDRSRSATVVARTAVELWRLTKEKFDGLVEENPWLILHFTQVIGDRLHETNQQLSKVHAAFAGQMDALLRALPVERQEFLTRTAILSALEPETVQRLLGRDDVARVLADLEGSGTFVYRYDGTLRYFEAVRELLHERLQAELSVEDVRALHQRAAALYADAGRWDYAVTQLLDAGDARAAAALMKRHAETLITAGRGELLHRWLARLPDAVINEMLPDLQARIEQASPPQYGRSAAASGNALDALVSARTRWWIAALGGIVAAAALWTVPPFRGLTAPGMHMLALLAWAVVFWAFDVLPDYVVGLGLIIGWTVFKIVPAEVAVSGFTTSPFFLIIGVLGIAASLQSSGLLFRLALQIMRRFPLTYRGQALGLALSGTAVSPGIPDVTSGVAVAAPIVLALSETLGYARRSSGSAGLAMAAMLGFAQMSPFFLTGAAENLLAWGLLPEAARAEVTWVSWALAALPLAVVTFFLGFTATMLFFPPEFQPTISRGLIDTQIEALGRMSRAEQINGVVLLAAVLGWITAPYHGVNVATVAMGALAVLLAADLLDRATFRAGIYWDFLFYLGAVLSLTGVVRHLGVDGWVIRELTPVLAPLAAHPGHFLVVVALAVFAARFILPSFPLVSLLIVTLVPIATAAGIKPLALALVICTTVAVWFLPYQSTYYLALYFGTKQKAFTHGQVRLLAWSYGAIYLLAILLAIPYWHAIGLLP